MTIQEVNLHWSKGWGFGDLYRNPDFYRFTAGLYAFLSPSPLALLYIGMTYDQSFSREVANHLGPRARRGRRGSPHQHLSAPCQPTKHADILRKGNQDQPQGVTQAV